LAIRLPGELPHYSTSGDKNMQKTIAVVLLFIGVSGAALAVPVPEIDPSSAGSALALVAGALLMMRTSRKK
jgi:hypothetical protein